MEPKLFSSKSKTGSLFKQNAKSRQCVQKRVAVSAQTNEGKLEHGNAKPNWVIETTDGWVGYEPQTENRQGQETLEGIGKSTSPVIPGQTLSVGMIWIFRSARRGSRWNSHSATFPPDEVLAWFLIPKDLSGVFLILVQLAVGDITRKPENNFLHFQLDNGACSTNWRTSRSESCVWFSRNVRSGMALSSRVFFWVFTESCNNPLLIDLLDLYSENIDLRSFLCDLAETAPSHRQDLRPIFDLRYQVNKVRVIALERDLTFYFQNKKIATVRSIWAASKTPRNKQLPRWRVWTHFSSARTSIEGGPSSNAPWRLSIAALKCLVSRMEGNVTRMRTKRTLPMEFPTNVVVAMAADRRLMFTR